MRKTLRVGDWIKIINPEIFIRCGYDRCVKDEKEKILTENMKEIEKLFHDCNIDIKQEMIYKDVLFKQTTEPSKKLIRAFNTIARELAYIRISVDGFISDERKIYTQRDESLKDKTVKIIRVQHVKTGIRHGPVSYTSYEGEHEYENGYLSEMKSHKILWFNYDWSHEYGIEVINIERVDNDKF